MKFATTLPVHLFTRPAGDHDAFWQPMDEGPGYFEFTPDVELMLYLPRAENETIETLVAEWGDCPFLYQVDVSEGRRVTDVGLRQLSKLTQVRALNVSACHVSNVGMEHLLELPALDWLDISHCTGVSDKGLRRIETMQQLRYLNLRGVRRVTQAGLKRLAKNKHLEIKR
ncbi:MAG: hypothetical protein V2J07_04650 [Anaerolineae bacterium]|jgi:hypothetical protein|nr:hypothetical protein [Anaerolineae bacterium]